MNRRSFFGMLSALAAMFGFGATAKVSSQYGKPDILPPGQKLYRQIYRHDGYGWKEIAWRDIRPKDKIIMVGAAPQPGVLEVECWEMGADASVDDFTVTGLTEIRSVLPRIWGNPKANEVGPGPFMDATKNGQPAWNLGRKIE